VDRKSTSFGHKCWPRDSLDEPQRLQQRSRLKIPKRWGAVYRFWEEWSLVHSHPTVNCPEYVEKMANFAVYFRQQAGFHQCNFWVVSTLTKQLKWSLGFTFVDTSNLYFWMPSHLPTHDTFSAERQTRSVTRAHRGATLCGCPLDGRRNIGSEVSPSNLCQNHVGSCIQGCHPKKNAEDCKFQTRTYPEIALTWAETLPRCLL